MNLKDFEKLNQATVKGKRTPHKPLLILFALSLYQSGHERLIPFCEIEKTLKRLLSEYGPSAKKYAAELPFYHLQNDGLWELAGTTNEDKLKLEELKSANRSFFFKQNISGGFTEELFKSLDEKSIQEISTFLLNKHFPESIHEDILNEINLQINLTKDKRKRDPKFRSKILTAYENKCAICNFRAIYNGYTIGIEAAHIKWHQAEGPDSIENGVALCSLHHKLFDRGIFTINDSMKIKVSEKVIGNEAFDELMLRYHGKELIKPIRPTYYPKEDFLEWHVREVFKEPG